MRARAKDVARAIAPPVVWSLLRALRRRLRGGEPIEWEYAGDRWDEARLGAAASGWTAPGVAAKYRERWPAFVAAIQPPQPLSVAHEALAERDVDREDPSSHNALVSFAYVLAMAAGTSRRLSVLDWGGGLGHYAAVARSAWPHLELDYHCKEVPAVCAVGREVNPSVTFHDTDACLDRTYDLVLASGSFHYAPNWRALLARLAGATRRMLYVTRVPIVFSAQSFLVVQRAYAYGYGTEYVGWFLNRDELLAAAEDIDGVSLRREFLQLEYVEGEGAPEAGTYRGFLFERT